MWFNGLDKSIDKKLKTGQHDKQKGKSPFTPGQTPLKIKEKSPLCRFPHPDTFDQNKYGAPEAPAPLQTLILIYYETLLQIAMQELGVRKFRERSQPANIALCQEAGFPGYTSDESAWCSLFMNWVAQEAGLEKSGSLAARSWLNKGFPSVYPNLEML